ncbi:Tim44 domain-containing protein [Rhizobiaceae bacterium n13]|uniref:Tim44 domain-containing protein n=1 Tax=Ferirhizobium litorale TaxID=2927786 RepID=A0AAE3QCL7_9HYPH|nr:Tim44 domain-containing protein [Fererhizobium litorale]MDI7860601.1 Tim44 domain-containing protein [Fererhizobium litorale]MDI7920749.1 Tim44 domain-containing protein [Fererhizobium litorale]
MFSAVRRLKNVFAVLALGLAVSFVAVDLAEARRASGGFGSRGTRTFQAPPATRTAPAPAAPIDRSMTPRTNQATQPNQPGAAATQTAARPGGFFGGFGRSLMGGLLVGGLLGMLLGHGFGGAFGFLGMLLQVALIGGAIMLAMRFFANRNQPAYSGSGSSATSYGRSPLAPTPQATPSFQIPKIGSLAGSVPSAGASQARPAQASASSDEIGVTQDDLDVFEKMLQEVQSAYAEENYGTLRRLTTPEAMSYLAEELSDNATSGLKNEVRDVHLVQGDVAEAWREDGKDYATVAMRYESIDVMRDRKTGSVIEGDEHTPTETVELWTFTRRDGTDWQVSAIQAAA